MSSQFRVIMTDTKPAVYLSTFASIDDMCDNLQHSAQCVEEQQFARSLLLQFVTVTHMLGLSSAVHTLHCTACAGCNEQRLHD